MSAAPESPNSAAPSSAAAVTVKVDAPSVLPADGVAAGAAPTAGGATPTHASTDASSSDPTPSSPKAADAKGKKGRGGRGKPKEVLPRVPFRQLFRYATGADMLLNTIAAVAATGNGFIFPGFALLFGDLLSQFNTVTSTDEFVAKINRYALWFLLIAIGAGVTALLENALPMITAERQIRRVREAYVNALLRQEVAFYDTNKAGELASRMIEDTLTMSGGIAEKSFASIHYSITFLGGIAVGFARSWQLTLVMFGALPVIMVVMAFLTNSVRKVRVPAGRLRRVAWPVKPAQTAACVGRGFTTYPCPHCNVYLSFALTSPRCLARVPAAVLQQRGERVRQGRRRRHRSILRHPHRGGVRRGGARGGALR